MKKLPPRKSWRDRPSRGSPSTDVIGVGCSTTGIWHDWQLCVVRKALWSHSW